MKIKILLPILCLFLLAGCGQKEKNAAKDYPADEIFAIHIQNDSAPLTLSLSPDDAIHISAREGAVRLEDGQLTIAQTDGAKNALEQFSFGKKETLSVSLPAGARLPISVENNSGDLEISQISASDLQLENASGYCRFTDVTADSARIASGSGDIKIADGKIADLDLRTDSGYVTLENPASQNIRITAKSGEANLSRLNPQTTLDVSTDSGDIGVAYQSAPESLDFEIASGSRDVTAKLRGARYETDTDGCKKGTVGAGAQSLTVESDTGTVIIR